MGIITARIIFTVASRSGFAAGHRGYI